MMGPIMMRTPTWRKKSVYFSYKKEQKKNQWINMCTINQDKGGTNRNEMKDWCNLFSLKTHLSYFEMECTGQGN